LLKSMGGSGVMNLRVLGAVLCAVMLAPAAALAQQVPLSQALVRLIQSDIRLAPPPAGFVSHEAHFLPGADQRLAPYLFNQQLVTQLATFPIGSSSGGFSFSYDTSLGVFQRATDTFGPSFAERALTNGRGKLTFGLNYQRSSYSQFNGQDLEGGNIKFYLKHSPASGAFFEGDVIEAALSLGLTSNTSSLFVNYGLTDDLDIAVAIPVVSVNMDANVNARVLRLATGADSPVHAFPGGSTSATFATSGSKTGLGDLLVRTKYRFKEATGGGMALGLDLRLPSGDAENLLGTGAAAFTGTLIGSTTRGRLSPHINLGFTVAGDGDVVTTPNEFGFKAGAEFEANLAVTFAVDLIGRSLLDAGKLGLVDNTWAYRNAAGQNLQTTLREYERQDGALNLMSMALGGKFKVSGNALLSANVLIALNNAGVTARVTPVVGLDFSF
jgi:hypothetical protein